MLYAPTDNLSGRVTLPEVLFPHKQPGGRMYMPVDIPKLPAAFFKNLAEMTLGEIAYIISEMFFGDYVSASQLKELVDKVYNFPLPVKAITPNIHALELFHGPTLSFKDFGARLLARYIEMRAEAYGWKRLAVIVSSSGNTASAIANAFAALDFVEVFILFPHNRSNLSLQRQFTTLGGNIHAIEITAEIDKCNALAKALMNDKDIYSHTTLISGNSANIMRLIGQIPPIFYGVGQMMARDIMPVQIAMAIPSGNMSNLTATLMAMAMGLKIGTVIASENFNDSFSQRLATGQWPKIHLTPTLAYAADKARPSNSARIDSLLNQYAAANVKAMGVSDLNIINAVNTCINRYNYVPDPHSAMAWHSLNNLMAQGLHGMMLATAHPAKSLTTMAAITGRAMDLPLQLNNFTTGRDHRISASPDYNYIKEIVLNTLNTH